MKVINECCDIAHFNAWSGAKDTQASIIENGKTQEFNQLIEELYKDGLTDTQLNDILWFEEDWIFENLGIKE
jgi:hypothetical protein